MNEMDEHSDTQPPDEDHEGEELKLLLPCGHSAGVYAEGNDWHCTVCGRKAE